MITSIEKWSTKEQLRKIVQEKPDTVAIIGTVVRTGKEYDGLVSMIPYHGNVAVKYKGKTYCFLKMMDGSFSVY